MSKHEIKAKLDDIACELYDVHRLKHNIAFAHERLNTLYERQLYVNIDGKEHLVKTVLQLLLDHLDLEIVKEPAHTKLVKKTKEKS